MMKKNEELNMTLKTYKAAVKTLQADGSHFDKIADFWGEF